jgi:hypothetical protein
MTLVTPFILLIPLAGILAAVYLALVLVRRRPR